MKRPHPAAMKRSEREIIRDLRDVECDLSPENLSGDGEYSPSYVNNRFRELTTKKRALLKELGRNPTWEELYSIEED